MAGDVMGRVTPSPILFQEQIGCYSNPTHFIFRNGLTFRPPVEKNETLLQIIFAVVGAGMAAAVYLGLYDPSIEGGGERKDQASCPSLLDRFAFLQSLPCPKAKGCALPCGSIDHLDPGPHACMQGRW
jgi:hypothetical protein